MAPSSRAAVLLAGAAAGLACAISRVFLRAADAGVLLVCRYDDDEQQLDGQAERRRQQQQQQQQQQQKSLERDLAEYGVCTIDGVYSAAQIAAFAAQHDILFAQHCAVKTEADGPHGTGPERRIYVQDGAAGGSVDLEVDVYDLPCGDEFIQVAPGRFDFCSGMDAGIFGRGDFHEPPIVAELMKRLLKGRYAHYAGALPSVASSQDGPWHRDTYELFDDFDKVDCALPPFYYNVLIPLVDLTVENGAT